MARALISIVTLGRDSNMTPSTPSGTRRFATRKPLGSVRPSNICPRGSGNEATSRHPCIIPRRRFGVRVDRSISAADIPAFSASAMSCLFASQSSEPTFPNRCAISSSAAFLTSVGSRLRRPPAVFARIPMSARLIATIRHLLILGVRYPTARPSCRDGSTQAHSHIPGSRQLERTFVPSFSLDRAHHSWPDHGRSRGPPVIAR